MDAKIPKTWTECGQKSKQRLVKKRMVKKECDEKESGEKESGVKRRKRASQKNTISKKPQERIQPQHATIAYLDVHDWAEARDHKRRKGRDGRHRLNICLHKKYQNSSNSSISRYVP